MNCFVILILLLNFIIINIINGDDIPLDLKDNFFKSCNDGDFTKCDWKLASGTHDTSDLLFKKRIIAKSFLYDSTYSQHNKMIVKFVSHNKKMFQHLRNNPKQLAQQKVSWLPGRTFDISFFFCQKNGFEASIGKLIALIGTISNPDEDLFIDIGSNLGFYTIVAALQGFQAHAFDISSSCLRGLYHHSTANNVENKVHLHQIGIGDNADIIVTSDSGCDYENYMIKKNSPQLVDEKDHGNTDKSDIPVLPFDIIYSKLDNGNKVISAMKIDVEGAEVQIIKGMNKLLSSNKVKNIIVELTPSHWFRFGLDAFATEGINEINKLTTIYGYDAYLLHLPSFRYPPTTMKEFIIPINYHPLNKIHNKEITSVQHSGCGATFYKILDMKRFMIDYCKIHLANLKCGKEKCKGRCGNIWFTKQ